jgi:hypothetical protein
MAKIHERAGLIVAGLALIGLGACGRSDAASMDAGLKQDLSAVSGNSLELAPKGAQPQVVVSAIEAGPTSAPQHVAVHKPAQQKANVKPSPRPVEHVAQAPAPAPTPVVQQHAPAPSPTVEPPPLPPVTQQRAQQPAQRQRGTYKTEAQIFQQMPWIRP